MDGVVYSYAHITIKILGCWTTADYRFGTNHDASMYCVQPRLGSVCAPSGNGEKCPVQSDWHEAQAYFPAANFSNAY